MSEARHIRTWRPWQDNMADLVEVEVLDRSDDRNDAGEVIPLTDLHGLTPRQLLILHDAASEELFMRGVVGF